MNEKEIKEKIASEVARLYANNCGVNEKNINDVGGVRHYRIAVNVGLQWLV